MAENRRRFNFESEKLNVTVEGDTEIVKQVFGSLQSIFTGLAPNVIDSDENFSLSITGGNEPE